MKDYNCKTCAFKAKAPNGTYGCFVTKLPINLETDFCSMHTQPGHIRKCSICGDFILPHQPAILEEKSKDEYILLCGRCLLIT